MAEAILNIDAYSPQEIARKVEQVGVAKASLPFGRMAGLATLAGMFVALGGMFYTTVTSDVKGGFGVTQLLGGLVFTLGLFLVCVSGAELFTGNNLLAIGAATGKIRVGALLRNWAVVWTFNLVGSLLLVAIMYYSQQWTAGGNLVGARVLYIGASKASLAPGVIFFRGILANLLVCLASWMAYGGRSVTDKLMAMILPVSAFVAAGFEHSVANMYFIPYAMALKNQPSLVAMPGVPVEKLHYLTMPYLAQNLFFSTLGNLVGGAVLVGLFYWGIYLYGEKPLTTEPRKRVA
jgi:formate/nitrite transporter